jgi:CDP-diacylglycerol---glycerol-3-phosphate 3-phosphatidyltransferase
LEKEIRVTPALHALRRRWRGAALTAAAIHILLYLYLAQVWPEGAGRWAVLAALALAYNLFLLRGALPENRRAGEAALLPGLGWGNWLTLLRGMMVSLLAGFLFSPWPLGGLAWFPVLLYLTAAVADFFDGYLARINNQATELGARLDMQFDGQGTLVVIALAVWYGQLPLWYLSVGLARYLFIFGLWRRERQGLAARDMTPSAQRRIIAGFQMGFLAVVLWPILPAEAVTLAGTIFALATLASFARDWLVVSGQIDPASPTYRRWRDRAATLIGGWLPLAARLALAAALWQMATHLPALWPPPESWTAVWQSWRVPGAAILTGLFVVVFVWAGITAVLGAAPRLSAFALVFPVGSDIVAYGLGGANGLALAALVWLMLFGGGRAALWPVEERFVTRRAGEKERGREGEGENG